MAYNNVNDIEKASAMIKEIGSTNIKNIKYIKRDNSLLEKDEADGNKVILVEDNRQLLLG